MLVVGSEVGISDLSGKQIVERQRLGPGEILLVNPASGEFVRPKDSLRLRDGIRPVSSRSSVLIAPTAKTADSLTLEPNQMMAAMGWSEDQFRLLFLPLVEQGQEAVWSMGDDAPPASLPLSDVRCGITASKDSRRLRIPPLTRFVKLT